MQPLDEQMVDWLFNDSIPIKNPFIKEYSKSRFFYSIINDSLRTKGSIKFLSNFRFVFSKLYREISDLGQEQLEKHR